MFVYGCEIIFFKTGYHLTFFHFSIDSMAAKVKKYEKQRYEAMKQLLPPLRQKQQPAAGLQLLAAQQQQQSGAGLQLQQLHAANLQQPMAVQSLHQAMTVRMQQLQQPPQQQPACVPAPKWPSHNQPVRLFVKFADKAGEFIVSGKNEKKKVLQIQSTSSSRIVPRRKIVSIFIFNI